MFLFCSFRTSHGKFVQKLSLKCLYLQNFALLEKKCNLFFWRSFSLEWFSLSWENSDKNLSHSQNFACCYNSAFKSYTMKKQKHSFVSFAHFYFLCRSASFKLSTLGVHHSNLVPSVLDWYSMRCLTSLMFFQC